MEAIPADWNTRLQSACLLYDQGVLHEASALIWEAERIPCTAPDLALAACILAKDQPGKAIRVLTAVLENNRGKAAQNMGMANALLHHGMVLQSARFYGAALEINPELVNLEFEHFFIWADDEQLLWRDFKGRRSQLHELPWMVRDSTEALELTRDVSRHTTPIAVPKVDQVNVGPSATTEALRAKLTENPGDWDTRRTLAQLLHDHDAYGEAAVLIKESAIPCIDLDTAFATRVLAREEPREAVRLLTAVFEQNRGKAVQNMGVVNALLHHGMVIEAACFYGAALEADPNLVNPDFEHFLLWTDDAKSLWGNFLEIRPPLGLFPWAHSDPAFDFGVPFSTPPIVLSGLKQVQGENLTNNLYQQIARKNARITPPPSVTFPTDREAEEIAGLEPEEAKVEAAAKARADEESTTLALAKQQTEQRERATAAAQRLAEEQAAAEAKAASLFAEAAESARTLIEQARQEATTEVAAIRAKAQEELQAALEQARQNTEQEMAAIRAKAREEAEAAADTARKDAEFQAALIRAKAEEAAAQAEAAAKLRAEENARALALAKQRTEEEERSAATAKQLAVEQANAAAEQAAAAQVAAEKARQEAISEVAAMRSKAQEELKATLEQARQNSQQEMAAIRAKAREEAESEAALIRTKAEQAARAEEKARLEAATQAEAAAKLRAEENDRALALAKQRAEEEALAAAAAKRLAEEQARAAAEKIHQEAVAEASALRAQAQDELKAASEQARRKTEQESAAIRAKAEEDAKKAAAAAEQARLEAAAQAKAAAEILARAEQEALALALAKQRAEEEEQALAVRKRLAEEQTQAAAEQARQEALAELAAIKAQAQEALKTATEQARLNAEQELHMLRAKAREESRTVMENAAREAASEVTPISPKSEEDAKLGSSMAEFAPSVAVANAAAVIKARGEQERAIPVAEPIAKERPNAMGKAPIRQQRANTKRRFGVLLVSAVAALGVWQWIPGTVIDRAAFTLVARGFANPPFFITGEGSRTSPWKLRTFTSKPRLDPKRAPLIVSLGDDVEGVFQSSPPSPIDLAVILSNFQRLGAKKAATAAVLAWDAPDPIGLAALDKTLGRFDSLVMAAPLGRGAVAESMPPAFRNASVPTKVVRGDITSLPVVNRVPLRGVILGGANTLAGFQTLDSERAARFPPLLARWDDRVVFAFPLLAAMQGLGLPLDGIEIRLGEYLKLGPQGPVVPLDRFGRLASRLGHVAPFAEIPAATLIDGGDDLFPKQAPQPVILRDDHSAAEPATRAFSEDLAAVTAAIASDTSLAPARAFRRFTVSQEIVLLSLLIATLKLVSLLPVFTRNIGFLLLAGFCLTAQAVAASSSIWLPTLPALAAIAAGAAAMRGRSKHIIEL